jgi:hypothetical protein
MRVIYGCFFFCLAVITPAFSQDKCKTRIEYAVVESPSKGYSITLQSSENLRNADVELYDLYLGKTVAKKYVGNGLRNKQTVFSGLKPSLYLIYVKHDDCPRAQSVGGIQGIKVGNTE